MDESDGSGMNRRRFLKGAAHVAWATPVIWTLAGGAARAQALTCLSPGVECGPASGSTLPCCDAAGADTHCCCSRVEGGAIVVTCLSIADCTTAVGTCIQD